MEPFITIKGSCDQKVLFTEGGDVALSHSKASPISRELFASRPCSPCGSHEVQHSFMRLKNNKCRLVLSGMNETLECQLIVSDSRLVRGQNVLPSKKRVLTQFPCVQKRARPVWVRNLCQHVQFHLRSNRVKIRDPCRLRSALPLSVKCPLIRRCGGPCLQSV